MASSALVISVPFGLLLRGDGGIAWTKTAPSQAAGGQDSRPYRPCGMLAGGRPDGPAVIGKIYLVVTS